MKTTKQFDVIIVGGSYSGLSAGMALGRSLKNVLIIDSAKPCNIQTPFSHNFLTQDDETPSLISQKGRNQVEKYNTVTFYDGIAISGSKSSFGFVIETKKGDLFESKKLLFSTGIKDIFPAIDGFSDCWGISILHCPYCHGYEVKKEKTAILGNGEFGFEFSKMIKNWTNDLTLFTNGKSTLSEEHTLLLLKNNIKIVETEIDKFEHIDGMIKSVRFKDDTYTTVKAIYSKVPFVQHCDIPLQLGCELTEKGYLKVNEFQQTTVKSIYAAGDNTTHLRSVSNAVATGSISGTMLNKEIIDEAFYV